MLISMLFSMIKMFIILLVSGTILIKILNLLLLQIHFRQLMLHYLLLVGYGSSDTVMIIRSYQQLLLQEMLQDILLMYG